ncbi:MAG TPA: stage V sporulation protein S [Chloroflexi bacterium]|jgi:stage V sporulation protein S|nr:stage V sporulation protein S [Chloroflexota bacterium]
MGVLKVSAHSKCTAVAGAIAGVIRDCGRAEVQAIGAGAVNQAAKAVAIARSYLALDGLDVVLIPSFTEVSIADQVRTALKLVVECRQPIEFSSPAGERRGSRQFLERVMGGSLEGQVHGAARIASPNGEKGAGV